MSVINQVLNELEKRGAYVPLDEAPIRPVPPRRQLHLVRYALLAVTLLILVEAARWYVERALTPAPERPFIVAAKQQPQLAPASAVAMANASSVPASDDGLHGKLLVAGQDEERRASPRKRARGPQEKRQVAGSPAYAAAADSGESPLKKISPHQRAENEFDKANLAAQQGRTNDALAGYEAALLIDSSHKEARRAWVGLLIGLKRNDDAERVLQKGLRRDPHDTSFAMLLARLQVESNAVPLALETLQKALPYAEGQADYQAFMAALLQRQGRHDEAIAYYQAALKLVPSNGIWLMGIGISLQATQRTADAREAYRRALASNSLNAQLQAFVQAKLNEL